MIITWNMFFLDKNIKHVMLGVKRAESEHTFIYFFIVSIVFSIFFLLTYYSWKTLRKYSLAFIILSVFFLFLLGQLLYIESLPTTAVKITLYLNEIIITGQNEIIIIRRNESRTQFKSCSFLHPTLYSNKLYYPSSCTTIQSFM